MLATANKGKTRERFCEKMQVNGPEGLKYLAVGVACKAIYGPAPGLKGRTFELRVFNRCVFNFCVRSTPLWGLLW